MKQNCIVLVLALLAAPVLAQDLETKVVPYITASDDWKTVLQIGNPLNEWRDVTVEYRDISGLVTSSTTITINPGQVISAEIPNREFGTIVFGSARITCRDCKSLATAAVLRIGKQELAVPVAREGATQLSYPTDGQRLHLVVANTTSNYVSFDVDVWGRGADGRDTFQRTLFDLPAYGSMSTGIPLPDGFEPVLYTVRAAVPALAGFAIRTAPDDRFTTISGR